MRDGVELLLQLREPLELRLQFLRDPPDLEGEIHVSVVGQFDCVGCGGTTFTPGAAFALFAARTGRTLRTTVAFGTAHQDLTTTQRYMHLSPAAIEGAIRLLDQPKTAVGRGDILETAGREKVN